MPVALQRMIRRQYMIHRPVHGTGAEEALFEQGLGSSWGDNRGTGRLGPAAASPVGGDFFQRMIKDVVGDKEIVEVGGHSIGLRQSLIPAGFGNRIVLQDEGWASGFDHFEVDRHVFFVLIQIAGFDLPSDGQARKSFFMNDGIARLASQAAEQSLHAFPGIGSREDVEIVVHEDFGISQIAASQATLPMAA